MLVYLLILMHVAVLCHGKSLNYRGKRLLNHGESQYQPFVDEKQSNNLLVEGNFYYPKIDGQPIYIPSISHSANDMNELLDDYYRKNKAFTKAWTLSTPVPYNFDNSESNYYESSVTSNSMVNNFLGDTDEDGHRGGFHILPTSQSKYEYSYEKNEERGIIEKKGVVLDENYVPEEIGKYNINKYESSDLEKTKSMLDKNEQPVVLDAVTEKEYEDENSYIPKTEYRLEYEENQQSAVHDKVNIKKFENENSEIPNTESRQEYVDDEYEPSALRHKSNIKKYGDKKIHKIKSKLEYVNSNYEQPVVRDRINIKKNEDGNSYTPKIESELENIDNDDEYEPPFVRNRSNMKKYGDKKIPLLESKLDNVDYEQPVVRDRVNIKDGNSNIPKSELKLEYVDDGYEQPVVRDRVNIKDGNSDIPKSELKLEYVDDGYEQPVVRDRINVKDVNSDIPKTESIMEYVDNGYKQPVVRDRINIKDDGNSFSPNTESKLEYADDDYEQPVIRDKVKVKVENSYTPKTESKQEYVDYGNESPVMHETFKQDKVKIVNKQEKGVKVSSDFSYGDESIVTRATIKKSNKGKRRKQSQFPKNYETSSEHSIAIVKRENLEEFHKKEKTGETLDAGNHELKKSQINTKNKAVIKSKPKEVPVESKDKVVIESEPKETTVKIKEKVVIKSKPKETSVKIKKKVVIISEPKETPVKIKEKVVIKSEPIETPVQANEEVVINYQPNNEYVFENPEYSITGENDQDIPDDIEPEESTTVSNIIYRSGEDIAENIPVQESEIFPDSDQKPFNMDENGSEFENNGSGTLAIGENPLNVPKFFHNIDAIRSISSLNANIWSLIFNPNAERNRQKKCVTRRNETGYCTYIQHCEVPAIAASLEQLLNNACVIDDIFIGVCCPEFPVESVQVLWEHDISNSDKQTEAEFGDNADDCGIRSNEASKLQSWPWKAPLISMSNGKIFCGGVVISEDYVLTAAHCTTKIPRNQILVRLGQYDDSTGDDFAVIEIKRHAKYNPRTMHNDVALLKLGRRIVLDKHTGVICLPEDDDNIKHNGEKAVLLGWKGMFGTNSKKTEFLEVMDNNKCGQKLRTNVPKTVLCTEARSEHERTCNADSGAPLVMEDDGKYEVIGILSWNRNDCDQRFPSTFSRVSSYVGWIQKHAV